MRTLTLALLMAAALTSGGCTVAAVAVMDQLDETVSKVAQADCELIRFVHGMDICRNYAEAIAAGKVPAPNVYCYRRLGKVDCYAAQDPHDRPIVHRPVADAAGTGPALATPPADPPSAMPEPRPAPPTEKGQHLVERSTDDG